MKKAIRGRVIYGGRAFHQDATEAMRGDIIRGLIETITNSDDAYEDKKGKIRVEIEHRRGPWAVVVRDRAKGMSSARMEEAIVRLGGRTSGFERGETVRGNLGRGAKDLAAFGTVVLESICNERYSSLTLEQTGDYELAPERNAAPEERERLHIPRGNGTVVTINVLDNIRCPHHGRLKEKLSKHYQLRDIFADPYREVLLVDVRKGTKDILRYNFPELPVVFSAKLSIEGYLDATANVTIYRNPERYDDPPSDSCRPGGLLIKGRRAIYENTLFRFESNPHAGWFSGRVECPYIDELASEYDRRLLAREKQDHKNNIPIITRRRDGLQPSHPFYKALSEAVEKPLGGLIEAEEKKSRERAAGEGSRMRRTLDSLGRELARLIDEDLREIDEEGLPGEECGVKPPPIKIVPEQAVLYMGEDKTLTIQVRANPPAAEVEVQVDPEGVVELLNPPKVLLSPHRKRPDLVTAQIRLRPLLEDEATLVSARNGDDSADALVEVRAERIVEEVTLPSPDTLQFERDRYRLAWMKKKELRLLAPVESVAEHGAHLRVTSDDPGVVILGGGTTLLLDEDMECYASQVTVEARTLGARSTLRAELGTEAATCKVVVSREEEGPDLQIRIVDEEAGNRRALVERENEQQVIKIMGRHPVMKRYRGPAPDFPGEDLVATKSLVAEIVAGEAARMLMERKFPVRSGMDQLDAARLYAEHYRYLSKYLNRCHRVLVPDPRQE